MTKETVSHTRKVTFRRCRRLHELMYYRGIRPAKVAMQLAIGTVMHLWLEAWFGAQQFGDRPRWIPHTASIWGPDESRGISEMYLEREFQKLTVRDPYETARLRAMVLAYHLRWRDHDWRVLTVERPFLAPFRLHEHLLPGDYIEHPHYERDGRIDAIIVDSDDNTWACEHKSHLGALDPDDDYWIKLRSDAQCSDYHVGARALGHDISGIIYDVVCKPDLDPLKATPVDKREMTIGWGCTHCGGGKDARGTGLFYPGGAPPLPPNDCITCKGTGWRAATGKSPSGEPRYKSHVRLHDETPGEYGLRCFETMITEPDRYLIRRAVVRLHDEIREHEHDDWATVQEIDEDKRRDHHPRNPDACFTFGGGGCEMRPVCWGGVDPGSSPLYTISKREPAALQPPAEEGL